MIKSAAGATFDADVQLLIIGAGAAGLCAALAAREAGVDALVIERDKIPTGSTALSAGLIPAAGTTGTVRCFQTCTLQAAQRPAFLVRQRRVICQEMGY